ncbi:Oidioi.mRNA.OKI2018_I69.XSR.g16020.t1.cds [Oikopleura dioica]|uniref:Oidioi.mRNA.OKI2018_I69.XSR.g16020.t1.cds n=1 Tax=Oikopleura dioica TaxID=34765 RepID=A0ABN7SF93_OIKDI|nr:Oidioi.mRNA.OKI2018_I69.XSR.g16020.t1.cds [Oikopleura dioica]
MINGGSFSNIDIALEFECNEANDLVEQIKETFEVPHEANIKLCYRGKFIEKLPSINNALIHASVLNTSTSGFIFSTGGEEIPFRSEILDAFNFIREKLSDDQYAKTRENIADIIKTALSKRYMNHSQVCKADQYGARSAASYDPNFAQPRSTVPLIQNLHSLSSNSQTQEEQPVPIQDPHRTGMITAPITTDMLRNALLATEEHMRATGQTVENMVESTPENRNIESAAQEILAEIAALATNVENGLEKLREMGLLDSIGEDAARRILQDMGGNIDATVETIMRNWDSLQK